MVYQSKLLFQQLTFWTVDNACNTENRTHLCYSVLVIQGKSSFCDQSISLQVETENKLRFDISLCIRYLACVSCTSTSGCVLLYTCVCMGMGIAKLFLAISYQANLSTNVKPGMKAYGPIHLLFVRQIGLMCLNMPGVNTE